MLYPPNAAGHIIASEPIEQAVGHVFFVSQYIGRIVRHIFV